MRASDSTENENTKKMKVQAKTSTTAPPSTKAKSYSQVIEPEATTTAASKKSYKEYKPKGDSHTNIASPGTVAQLFQQLKGKVEKRTVESKYYLKLFQIWKIFILLQFFSFSRPLLLPL